MKIKIPDDVQHIINTLENSGYEAYAVGGCVRDSLLGKEPQDWDICTPALPEQVTDIFKGRHIIETGLQHGTITLMLNDRPFEITTYRVDGKYTDNRRPNKVKFVDHIKRDLARRDFTVNAMAYNPKTGLVDYYGGQQDLQAGIIKCAGNPNKRFKEDALRIMRAMRFASALGFTIESGTAQAMRDNRKLLSNIAAERVSGELNKLIVGDGVKNILSEHISIIAEIIPELASAIGFQQDNPCHCHDALNHILLSVDNAPKDIAIRLSMLFRIIAKPICCTESGGGAGQWQESSDMAKEILSRLRYDNDTVKTVAQLVLYHGADIQPRRKDIKRWLNKIGEERFRQLLEVKKADAMAQSALFKFDKMMNLSAALSITNEIIEQRQCFLLKDLAVNGRDLIDAGVSEGAEIGVILNKLMDMVIDEEAENDRAVLLGIAQEITRGIK